MADKKRASLIFIFITVLLDVVGFGVIIPIVPTLIQDLTGADVSESAVLGGFLIISFAGMQFLFAPILGELSDKYGRRPILLIALLGLGIDYLVHAIAPTFTILIISRLAAGVFGASFTVANSYVADISAPKDRAKNFGMIGAAFGLGFMIGPFIGGLAGQVSTSLPFYIAAGLTGLNFLYGLLFIPESLPKSKRRQFEWKRVIPFGGLVHLFKYKGVVGLILATFLMYLAHHSVQSVWTFYTKYKFSWSESMIGYSLGVAGLLTMIIQGGLIGIIVKKIGMRKAMMIGFVFTGIGLTLFGFASTGWMMFMFLIPFCIGGIATPNMQGIVTNQVPENEQGELQGAITSMQSITAIIGPLLMTFLFYNFSGKSAIVELPGMPFLVGAILVVISLFFAYSAIKKMPKESKDLGSKEIKNEEAIV